MFAKVRDIKITKTKPVDFVKTMKHTYMVYQVCHLKYLKGRKFRGSKLSRFCQFFGRKVYNHEIVVFRSFAKVYLYPRNRSFEVAHKSLYQ